MNCNMDPLEWDWKMENGKMAPIMTDMVIKKTPVFPRTSSAPFLN